MPNIGTLSLNCSWVIHINIITKLCAKVQVRSNSRISYNYCKPTTDFKDSDFGRIRWAEQQERSF